MPRARARRAPGHERCDRRDVCAVRDRPRAARDDDGARTSLEATRRLARRSGTIRIEAASLHFFGRLVGTRNLIEAEDCFRGAQALLDRDTDRGHYGSVLGDLGDIRWRRGARSEAYEMLVEAATLVESAGALDALAGLQHRLAMWSTEARRLDEARAYTRAAIELREKLGDPEHALELIHELGIIEQYAGRIDDATRYFEEVAHRAADVGAVERRALAQYHLGWLAYQQRDVERATTLERDSSVALEELSAYYFLAHNLMLRAVLFLYRGDVALGRRTLETAVRMSEQMDDAVNVQNCQALVRQLEAADPPEGVPFVVVAM